MDSHYSKRYLFSNIISPLPSYLCVLFHPHNFQLSHNSTSTSYPSKNTLFTSKSKVRSANVTVKLNFVCRRTREEEAAATAAGFAFALRPPRDDLRYRFHICMLHLIDLHLLPWTNVGCTHVSSLPVIVLL